MTGPIYVGRHEPDTSHERELDDDSTMYTVVSGTDANPRCQDFPSFAPALQAYRDARAFMLSREKPLDYELDMLPPAGVMLTIPQLNKMFDDSIPRGYLEANPHGKVPTTCGHGMATFSDAGSGLTRCVCRVCGIKWNQCDAA
jgi:hypothetical protein